MPAHLTQPQHGVIDARGVRIHYARITGGQRPLVLLHGWPEYWLTWLPLMQRLVSYGYDVIAPDLRGFGDSDNPDPHPSDAAGAAVHASDVLALLDALSLDRVGLVAHDVGAFAAQPLARENPSRLAGLFFFDWGAIGTPICPSSGPTGYPNTSPTWTCSPSPDPATSLTANTLTAPRTKLSDSSRGSPGDWVAGFLIPSRSLSSSCSGGRGNAKVGARAGPR